MPAPIKSILHDKDEAMGKRFDDESGKAKTIQVVLSAAQAKLFIKLKKDLADSAFARAIIIEGLAHQLGESDAVTAAELVTKAAKDRTSTARQAIRRNKKFPLATPVQQQAINNLILLNNRLEMIIAIVAKLPNTLQIHPIELVLVIEKTLDFVLSVACEIRNNFADASAYQKTDN